MRIDKGDRVLARDAHGEKVPMVAMSGLTRGHNFPIIWVCLPEDFARDGFERTDYWRPWPAEDVELDPDNSADG